MSDNVEIITRFEHAFRAADQATIDELCDPGLADHDRLRPPCVIRATRQEGVH